MLLTKLICVVVVVVASITVLSLHVEAGKMILASSTFDTDKEGWSVQEFHTTACELRTAFTAYYSPTGGNPGGNIRHDDIGGLAFYFKAPSKFLGDMEVAYGGSLSFDRKLSAPPDIPSPFDVILIGAGMSLVIEIASAGTTWTSQTVTLNVEADWEHCDGTTVNEIEMRSVLESLEVLLIRGDMVGGSETCALDNVILETGGILEVSLDIKPGSCPNPLNAKVHKKPPKNAKSRKGGVLPVAILGTAGFDVTDINISNLLFEGVPPLRHDFEDVAALAESGDECSCTTEGPDGHMDLTLKFEKSDIIATLGAVSHGDVIPLTLTGELLDGTSFEATDCVNILYEDPKPPTPHYSAGESVVLRQPAPNPFNPITRIAYVLPREDFVELSVYDITGKLIDQLVACIQPAGEHVVQWDAQGLTSGIYFCRIKVNNFTETRKMILIR